jgi:hypothetical protein
MANVFWFGDSGNWSDQANHWSNNSNNSPASLHGAVPGADDIAVFDAASFTTGTRAVTIDADTACLGTDWSAASNTPTLAFGSKTLTLTGDAIFRSAMAITGSSGNLKFLGAGAQGLTTGGLAITCNLWMHGSGTLTFNDNMTANGASWSISHTNGTLNTNGKFVTCNSGFNSTLTGGRVLNISGSTILINGWSWNLQSPALTFTVDGSSIVRVASGDFNGYSKTYNEVQLNAATHTITGDNVYAALTLPSATTQTITFTDGSTQTFTTATLSGDSTHRHTLKGSASAGWNLINSGTLCTLSYCTISNCKATGLFAFGGGVINGGGNTGLPFPKGGTGKLIAGGLLG